MKKNLLTLSLLLSATVPATAQINLKSIFDSSAKKAERNAAQRIEKKIDKKVNNTFDSVENNLDNVKNNSENNNYAFQEPVSNSIPVKQQSTLSWNKYDFVPGTEIIFEDDFTGERNGEFPSRWDITKGTVEIAEWGGEKVVWFKNTNTNVPDAILPYLKNRSTDYLPDEFTFEMDVYFHADYRLNKDYYIFFYDAKNQTKIFSPSKPIRIDYNSVTYNHIGDLYQGQNKLKPKEGWRHVAISFNKRALKGYLDDARLLNIPNVEFNPTGIMISSHNSGGKGQPFVKNIRIAKGAVPLYDKFLVDGKFVTTGITFDINKATIKPESMGTINYVVKMMQEHPELKFSVEGHTDSDGADANNQTLSEARAQAIVNKLIESGIAKERLTSKGWGESKPITNNETAEGKAQNRRVEFIKI